MIDDCPKNLTPRGIGLLALLAVGGVAAAAGAQEDPTAALELPGAKDSSAAVLLGATSVQIQRPTEPLDLAVALGGTFSAGEELAVPDNLAIEVAPYWLFSHPRLTLEEYEQSGWRHLYRNLAVSLASTRLTPTAGATTPTTGAATPETVTRLGVGLRTTLLRGEPGGDPELLGKCRSWMADAAVRQAEEALDVLEEAEREAARQGAAAEQPAGKAPVEGGAPPAGAEVQTAAAGDQPGAEVAPVRPAKTPAEQEAALEKRIQALLQVARSKQPAGCAEEASVRRWFGIDVGLALAVDFPAAEFEAGELGAYSGWLTFSYLRSHLAVLGLTRYQREDLTGSSHDFVDLGLRVIGAGKKAALWAEGLYRHALEQEALLQPSEQLFRATLGLDYQLKKGTWLTVSLGRGFYPDQEGSLLAAADVHWNFGERTVAQGVPDQDR